MPKGGTAPAASSSDDKEFDFSSPFKDRKERSASPKMQKSRDDDEAKDASACVLFDDDDDVGGGVFLPTVAIALVVLCSLSYLGGEIFRMERPDHPLTRFATSLVAPTIADGRGSRTGKRGRREATATMSTPTMASTQHHSSAPDTAAAASASAAAVPGGQSGHTLGGARTIQTSKGKATKENASSSGKREKNMPRPKLHKGKSMPVTKYTFGSQVNGTEAVRDSFHLHIEADGEDGGSSNVWGGGSLSGGNCDGGSDAAGDRYRDCAAIERDPFVAGDAEDEAEAEGNSANGEADADEEHLPAGQHLLVDIKNVDGTFLNSEERLAHAMVEVVNESKLTLLSYHCHSMVPSGVSCVGVLLESHISFHTWPVEGVITLDLFTCGSNPLLPSLKTIERLFGVPQPGAGTYQPLSMGDNGGNNGNGSDWGQEQYTPLPGDYVEPPRAVWSHVLRGFRPPLPDGRSRVLESDVSDIVLKRLDLDHKEEVATVDTNYQHVQIYDVIDPRFSTALGYERSIRPEYAETYEGMHPELFRPDRKIFLDGVVQSSRNGDAAYHEALVHPAMFAHPNPRRAAIVGGGEGAPLREVLKHNTVEHVKMIEIDEAVVNVSRTYLPDWSDCSDFLVAGKGEGAGAESCFDDPRAEVLFEDSIAWFIDRFKGPSGCDCEEDEEECDCEDDDEEASSDDEFGEDSSDDEESPSQPGHFDSIDDAEEEEKFDVIVMDALDPLVDVSFSSILTVYEDFLESLYDALTDEGVLVVQLGMSPEASNPAEEMGPMRNRAQVMSMIDDAGFASVHVYEESHCGFQYPWSFLVACKHRRCRERWYANEAVVNAEIHNRVVRTRSREPALKYFDGATMASYRSPSGPWETAYCRRTPQPLECAHRGRNEALLGPAKVSDAVAPHRVVAGSGKFNPVRDRNSADAAFGGDFVAPRDIVRAEEEPSANCLSSSASKKEALVGELRKLQSQCRGESVGQITRVEAEWEDEKEKECVDESDRGCDRNVNNNSES